MLSGSVVNLQRKREPFKSSEKIQFQSMNGRTSIVLKHAVTTEF